MPHLSASKPVQKPSAAQVFPEISHRKAVFGICGTFLLVPRPPKPRLKTVTPLERPLHRDV